MSTTDFHIFVLGLVGLMHFINPLISEWFEDRRYQRERKKFAAEVALGKSPNWCPHRTGYLGATKINPADLVQTASFKRTVAGCNRLVERAKREHVPGFEAFYGQA